MADKLQLTPEVVEELKKKYPRGIYKTVIGDNEYIWRPIYRDEYTEIVGINDADVLKKEEIIVATCLLFPEMSAKEIAMLDAGIPTTLSENIMTKSGFEATSVEKL